MALAPIPEPPAQLKTIQSYIKISNDIEKRDSIVSYWIRLYSTETALRIDKDSPECKRFLGNMLVWLENFKQLHKDDERVTNQTVGQAHFENYVMNIFNMADSLDRNGEASRKTVSMFFMSSMLFDTMSVFGNNPDEIQQRAKYAKFKAAYIQKCLKNGQVPKPGPIDNTDLDGSQPSSVPDQPDPSTQQTNTTTNQDYSFTFKPSSGPPPSSTNIPSSPLNLPETPDKDKLGGTSSGNTSISSLSGNNQKDSQGVKASIITTKFHAINGAPLKVDDLVKSQKYCKFATSALQYDDVNTAVTNLEKALMLLKTGQQPE